MTGDPMLLLTVASMGLGTMGIAAATGLRGWRGWLEVKRIELAGSGPDRPAPSPAARIELADLKERVRRLEAIAAGVDL